MAEYKARNFFDLFKELPSQVKAVFQLGGGNPIEGAKNVIGLRQAKTPGQVQQVMKDFNITDALKRSDNIKQAYLGTSKAPTTTTTGAPDFTAGLDIYSPIPLEDRVGGEAVSEDEQRNLAAEAQLKLIDEIAGTITELEDKLFNIGIPSLSQQDLDTFLQKAIEQVTPYYDQKLEDIQKGIQEGKIRNAEDLFDEIISVKQDTSLLFAKYDVEQAETDEELADTLANITATRDEDLELRRDEWSRQIKRARSGQVQTGILTSGVGKKEIADLLQRQAMEEAAVTRRAGVQEETAERTAKFDLKRIALARQAAEQERVRRIGTPEETVATELGLRETLGLGEGEGLGSRAEVLRKRAERNITVRRPEEIGQTEEEKKRAVESRKLTLQSEELDIRREKERRERERILSQLASKRAQLVATGRAI